MTDHTAARPSSWASRAASSGPLWRIAVILRGISKIAITKYVQEPPLKLYEPPTCPRPFQDHEARPRMAYGLSIDRLANRVASVAVISGNDLDANSKR